MSEVRALLEAFGGEVPELTRDEMVRCVERANESGSVVTGYEL